ncbi:MAG: hypothetical protein DMD63_16120 [Gemmatimonadetes bacterium]|nr:MAG: hypothetical protein DMD63_16120 [Gemmatimonadota bacterium]
MAEKLNPPAPKQATHTPSASGAALLIGVDAEAADAGHSQREVGFLLLRELLDVLGRHDLLSQTAQIFLTQRRQFKRYHVSVDAQRRRTSDFEVEIRSVRLNHVLQH